MKLFLIMFIVTVVEVVLIAKVGSLIGFFNTFIIILITAMIGSWQLKKQGLSVLEKLQTSQNPSDALIEGFILLICGILLIVPGFLTDIIGFLGLVPNIRSQFVAFLKKHQSYLLKNTRTTFFYSQQQSDSSYSKDDIIEGEVVDKKTSKPHED